MYTYGYIREATMAHLDLDEAEAQAMGIQSRFHIYANEAMQAICGNKPLYRYIEVTIVKQYTPLTNDNGTIRPATKEELTPDENGELSVILLDPVQTRAWYVEQNIYETCDKVSPGDNFIAYANKQVWKYAKKEITPAQMYEVFQFEAPLPPNPIVKSRAELGYDYAYIGANYIKFYKPGKYEVPAKYLWFRFESGIGDDTEIDMPSDILLTIPLYIAAICFQIDNPQRASVKRAEFEMALARCISTDFMELNEVRSSW